MKRFAEKELSLWLARAHRKPLILRGARQVGKSTLVRSFAKNEGLNLVEIDLEHHPLLNDIFKTKNMPRVLSELEAISGQSLNKKKTLLFLDEIQACPEAIAALRYFYEEYPKLPVIAAGSLLEFTLADHGFSMPVGRVEYFHLGPMTFGEFLLSQKEEALFNLLKNFKPKKDFPLMAHEKLLLLQRQFLFTGGMPEAVFLFAQTHSITEVRHVHQSIVQTYADDFAKYTKTANDRRLLHKVFESMPTRVGQKVKYAKISSEDRAAPVRAAIDLLIKARVLLPAYHSHSSGVPLRATQDEDIYKLYFLDCGLLGYLSKISWEEISKIPEHVLINEGVLAEQFIAQHLAYKELREPPALNYWLRESKTQNAEVDFVLEKGRHVVPVEVKSGKSGTLKSIQQFISEKKEPWALRFDLNLPSFMKINHQTTHAKAHNVSFQLLSLPLYMAEWVLSYWNEIKSNT